MRAGEARKIFILQESRFSLFFAASRLRVKQVLFFEGEEIKSPLIPPLEKGGEKRGGNEGTIGQCILIFRNFI
jgi:hypothetical protein